MIELNFICKLVEGYKAKRNLRLLNKFSERNLEIKHSNEVNWFLSNYEIK